MAETKPRTVPEPISEIQPHEPAMESTTDETADGKTGEKIVRQRLGDFFLEFKLQESSEDSPFGYVEAELMRVLAPLPRPAAVTYDGSKQPERELLLPSEQSAAALFAVRCEEEKKKQDKDGETPKKVNPYAPIEPTEEQKAEQEKKDNEPDFNSEKETSSQKIAPGTEQPVHTPARNVLKTPDDKAPDKGQSTSDRLKQLQDKNKDSERH